MVRTRHPLALLLPLAVLGASHALAAEAEPPRITALIQQLGHADYPKREAAQAALSKFPPTVLPILKRHRNHGDPEIRMRIREVIRHVQGASQRLQRQLEERLARAGLKVTSLSVDDRLRCTLNLSHTAVADLTPLRGMPLASLDIRKTKVTDLSPLAGMALAQLQAPFTITRGFEAVRTMRTLKAISGRPVGQFRRECIARRRLRDAGLAWTYIEVDAQGLCILSFSPTAPFDLAALKGTPVKHLDFRRCKWLDDLSPLKGIPLTGLNVSATSVRDVTPLAGMPLRRLGLNDTLVADLRPLKGMPLSFLGISGTRVTDLSPLKGMGLTYLSLARTAVADATPLRGMPLRNLYLAKSKVSDLRPLQGMPLVSLNIADTPVTDLSPLRGLKLHELFFSPDGITRGIGVIRQMASIKCLGGGRYSDHYIYAHEFWALVDAAALRQKAKPMPAARP